MIFPPGSLFDPDDLAWPSSPTTPIAFPFDHGSDQALDELLADLLDLPSTMDSVTHIVGVPCICGLSGDMSTTVTVLQTGVHNDSTLVDTGTNICIAGSLDSLVDVVVIPPIPISVVVHGTGVSCNYCCTHRGLLPLPMEDGTVYYQTCFYCKNIVKTIISPQAIVAGSALYTTWQQTGHKDGYPGRLRFFSDSSHATMSLALEQRDCLYYALTDVYTVNRSPVHSIAPCIHRVVHHTPRSIRRPQTRNVPVTKSNQTKLELWMLWLGSPGESQVDMLPGNATGIPSVFEYHPFRFLDFKEQARIRKQAAQRTAELTTAVRKRFYINFGFMCLSCLDFTRANKKTDCVIESWDGYSFYLLIVDEASQYVWVFLTRLKDPPLDIISFFLKKFGHAEGGSICTDQGSELAGLSDLADMILCKHSYVFKPTGADSPSQNGRAETYNDKLAVQARTFLHGAGLPAKYWSSALIHAVYLQNHLVTTST
jgi:hypothetical protein